MNKSLAVELAVIAVGLVLALFGQDLASVAWFAGYVTGYRKRIAFGASK